MIAKLGATGAPPATTSSCRPAVRPEMATTDCCTELDHSKLPNMKNLRRSTSTSVRPRQQVQRVQGLGLDRLRLRHHRHQAPLTSWADFLDAAQKEAGKNVAFSRTRARCRASTSGNGIDENTNEDRDLDAARIHPRQDRTARAGLRVDVPTPSLVGPRADPRLERRRPPRHPRDRPDRYKWVCPTPSANLWQDNWAIVKGAPHPDAAYEFINYVLDPTCRSAKSTTSGTTPV